ncbi:MAG TPA: DUF3460 family protein [Gallionella sp.]
MYPAYVSEFTSFIEHFMHEHPEEVVAQHAGWCSQWDVAVDPADLVHPREQVVRDDQYGFH